MTMPLGKGNKTQREICVSFPPTHHPLCKEDEENSVTLRLCRGVRGDKVAEEGGL